MVNRENKPLYWFDDTHVGITTDETPYPVQIYTYLEEVKMQMEFYDDGGTYVPRITIGAGTGSGDNAKAFIYKKSAGNGLFVEYYKSDDGTVRKMLMDDTGISFDPPLALSNLDGGDVLGDIVTDVGNGSIISSADTSNIASTVATISLTATGTFESTEWTHGFDGSLDTLGYLTTPGYYDDTLIGLRDLKVVPVTGTTCKVTGYAIFSEGASATDVLFTIMALRPLPPVVAFEGPYIYREPEYFPWESPLTWFNIAFISSEISPPLFTEHTSITELTLSLFNSNVTIVQDGTTLTPTDIVYVSPGIYRVTCDVPYDSEQGGSYLGGPHIVPYATISYDAGSNAILFENNEPYPSFSTEIVFAFINPM
jgi:hypothetical protein